MPKLSTRSSGLSRDKATGEWRASGSEYQQCTRSGMKDFKLSLTSKNRSKERGVVNLVISRQPRSLLYLSQPGLRRGFRHKCKKPGCRPQDVHWAAFWFFPSGQSLEGVLWSIDINANLLSSTHVAFCCLSTFSGTQPSNLRDSVRHKPATCTCSSGILSQRMCPLWRHALDTAPSRSLRLWKASVLWESGPISWSRVNHTRHWLQNWIACESQQSWGRGHTERHVANWTLRYFLLYRCSFVNANGSWSHLRYQAQRAFDLALVWGRKKPSFKLVFSLHVYAFSGQTQNHYLPLVDSENVGKLVSRNQKRVGIQTEVARFVEHVAWVWKSKQPAGRDDQPCSKRQRRKPTRRTKTDWS